uniref:Uncharacterized protein n=1 Tax=Rhizophora mucronata TaxID=61149 RepID=A0A2P2Q7I3_RHIMU
MTVAHHSWILPPHMATEAPPPNTARDFTGNNIPQAITC